MFPWTGIYSPEEGIPQLPFPHTGLTCFSVTGRVFPVLRILLFPSHLLISLKQLLWSPGCSKYPSSETTVSSPLSWVTLVTLTPRFQNCRLHSRLWEGNPEPHMCMGHAVSQCPSRTNSFCQSDYTMRARTQGL